MSKNTFVLSSAELKTDYHLFVARSPDAHAASPVVLVLDGDDQFRFAAETAEELERSKEIAPLVLVGVGYGGSYRSPLNRRVRDYTPTQPKDEPMPGGGAAAFHAFLEQKLMPELRRRLEVRADNVALTGHSLGSLFGLYAMAQTTPIFDRFLISSPSIWWDDRAVLNDVRSAATHPIEKPVKAFISVGEADTPSMTGDLKLLEDELRAHPRAGLQYVFERFPEKDHYNVLPTAFRAGLSWLYR